MPFDLTVFAQSFLLVQPLIELKKAATILSPGDRLALRSNRITPTSPHGTTSRRSTPTIST